jgi:hypothetical protein
MVTSQTPIPTEGSLEPVEPVGGHTIIEAIIESPFVQDQAGHCPEHYHGRHRVGGLRSGCDLLVSELIRRGQRLKGLPAASEVQRLRSTPEFRRLLIASKMR